MNIYTYSINNKPVFYNGHLFDSQLELQYVLTIEHNHAWLRDNLEIYYGLNSVSAGIKAKLHCYRPDLLIRDWNTGEASLVEIKPIGFTPNAMRRREKIATRHIKRFNYDWQFKTVSQSEIILTQDLWQKFQTILSEQTGWKHKPCQHILQNNSSFSDKEYDQYVRTGLLPASLP